MDLSFVSYEDFGAVGDGKADDQAAVIAAHAYANEHHLPVRTKPDAVYYIGRGAEQAVISTDTDWNTSRFIIDDRDTENCHADIFVVPPTGRHHSLPIPPVKAGQTEIDLAACGITLAHDEFVTVTSDERIQYIRFGPNQNDGSPQRDSFILTKEGKILSGINWNYTRYTSVDAIEIDEEPLVISGGHFTTIANQSDADDYYARGMNITRSNTTVQNVYHTVTGESDHGAPYSGFFIFAGCAYSVLRDCRVCGHKTYHSIGSDGKPVPMGTYDINCGEAIYIQFLGVWEDLILDHTRWGVFGSNHCKKMLFDGCVISRTDAHCGVRDYTIRNSVIGWMGTNTIGFGEMLMENVTCFSSSMVGFREDYGCTWDGNLTIRNAVWIPVPGTQINPVMFDIFNRGQHDFGYPCTLPHHILLENVTVVDTNTPKDYKGVQIFRNFHPELTEKNKDTVTEPYPLARPASLTIRNFCAVSGKPPVICDNMALFPDMKIVIE